MNGVELFVAEDIEEIVQNIFCILHSGMFVSSDSSPTTSDIPEKSDECPRQLLNELGQLFNTLTKESDELEKKTHQTKERMRELAKEVNGFRREMKELFPDIGSPLLSKSVD